MTILDELRSRHQSDPLRELWIRLKALTCVTSFMQTGAHPDDETTRLLARLSLGDGVHVTYANALRGQGGQNGIGPERGDELGLIRSRELEEAMAVINADIRWFTEEIDDPISDFGFSKTAEETFGVWGEEHTLREMVRAVRACRPDVMMPTFLDVPGQHGHHRAITQATIRAFELAGEPDAFPELAEEGFLPWSSSKLFLPAWGGGGGSYDDELPPPNATTSIEVGEFDPMCGGTYAQIAQWSRAHHATQGMGQLIDEALERVPLHELKSRVPGSGGGLFDGLPKRLADLASEISDENAREQLAVVDRAINEALAAFPRFQEIANALVVADVELEAVLQSVSDRHPVKHRLDLKRAQIAAAMASCAMLRPEFTEVPDVAHPGETLEFQVSVNRAGPVPIDTVNVRLVPDEGVEITNEAWQRGEPAAGRDRYRAKAIIGPDAPLHRPLRLDYSPLGTTSTPRAEITFEVDERSFQISVHPAHRSAILPSVNARFEPAKDIRRLPVGGTVSVDISANASVSTAIDVKSSAEWGVKPESFTIESTATHAVELTPPPDIMPGRYSVDLSDTSGAPIHSVAEVSAPHVGSDWLIKPAVYEILALDVAIDSDAHIGWIDGGVDNAHHWAKRLGHQVTMIDDAMLASGDFEDFDTIVLGVFALATRPALTHAMASLHDWIASGGNLVTKYHRPWDNWDPDATPPRRLVIGQPSIRWRITNPAAPVKVLTPDHPLLNRPNRISDEDWQGWHKERGLYFASEWDAEYEPLIAVSDPGEKPLEGGVLSARIGAGRYTHCAISLFHQMDHLVPGAFRLFANLLAPS